MNTFDDLIAYKTEQIRQKTTHLFEKVKQHIKKIGNRPRSSIECDADEHDLQVMRQLYPAFNFFTTYEYDSHMLNIHLKDPAHRKLQQ